MRKSNYQRILELQTNNEAEQSNLIGRIRVLNDELNELEEHWARLEEEADKELTSETANFGV